MNLLAEFFKIKKRSGVRYNAKRIHKGSDISEIAILERLTQKITREEISRLKRIIEQLITYNLTIKILSD